MGCHDDDSPGDGARSLARDALPVGTVFWHLAQKGARGLGQQRQRARVQDAAQCDLVGAVGHQLALSLVPDIQELLGWRCPYQPCTTGIQA